MESFESSPIPEIPTVGAHAQDEVAALRHAVEELSFLQHLAKVTSSVLDPDVLCELVIRETCDVLGVEVCSLYLVEDDELVLTSTNGLNPNVIGRARMRLGVGITGAAALAKEVIRVRDVTGDSRFHWIDGVDQERFTSMCSVPLVCEGTRVVGVLNVQTVDPCDWSDAETSMLIAIAAQLAGTVERSHLQRQVELRLEQSHAIGAAVAALVAAGDPNEVATLLAMHAARCADAASGCAALWLVDATGTPALAACVGEAISADIAQIGSELIHEVLTIGSLRRAIGLPEAGMRYAIGVPIRSRRGARGVLVAWAASADRMRNRDIDVFQTLADQGGLALDNAEALQAQQEATEHWRRLTEARSDLLSAVSHDLRTPLAVILTYVITLREEMIGAQLVVVDQVIEELRRIERMVGTMLTSLAMEAGAVPLTRQPTDVRELIGASCDALRSTDRSPSIDVEMPDEPVVVDVDPDTVRRVLDNLLTNAAQHAPHGSTVTVTLSRRGAMAEVAVRDHGVGVPLEDRTAIFDRFRRGSSGAPGTGIGLFVVKTMVAAHGGDVGVDTPDDGGARFWIRLPTTVPQ